MRRKLTDISTKNKNVFQCNYCPQSFSRRGAFRNHLRSHRDQVYLDENELARNTSTITNETMSTPALTNDVVRLVEEENQIRLDNQVCYIVNFIYYNMYSHSGSI